MPPSGNSLFPIMLVGFMRNTNLRDSCTVGWRSSPRSHPRLGADSAPAATITTVLSTLVACNDTHLIWTPEDTPLPERRDGALSSVRCESVVLMGQ